MLSASRPAAANPHKRRPHKHFFPQRFLNGAVHDWYRIVHRFPDHLVGDLLKEFGIEPGQRVLDPFCGTGTTLVECKKLGVISQGIDANPACVFAAQTKTNWRLSPTRLLDLIPDVDRLQRRLLANRQALEDDPIYRYFDDSGLIRRGWIGRAALRKSIAILRAIGRVKTNGAYRRAFALALVSEVVNGASNVRFGPELYRGPTRKRVNVMAGVRRRVKKMSEDLVEVRSLDSATATVILGDARKLRSAVHRAFDAVISSPPYPAEHDYTRNTRLELALLGYVGNLTDLRRFKKSQIRSHTKGIYKGDDDGSYVRKHDEIQSLARSVERAAKGKTDGFTQLYSTVVREYFGGMKRHFQSVFRLLRRGGLAAYVVGDQSGYGVHIPTANILASLAKQVGFTVKEKRKWRTRWATRGHFLNEHILILRRPKRKRPGYKTTKVRRRDHA